MTVPMQPALYTADQPFGQQPAIPPTTIQVTIEFSVIADSFRPCKYNGTSRFRVIAGLFFPAQPQGWEEARRIHIALEGAVQRPIRPAVPKPYPCAG